MASFGYVHVRVLMKAGGLSLNISLSVFTIIVRFPKAHLLRGRHFSKHFTYHKPFNPSNSSVR